MTGLLSRRSVLLAGGTLALTSCVSRPRSATVSRISTVEAALGGRIGAFFLDIETGRAIGYREQERFAMCSTFKVALAGAILAGDQAGEFSLTDTVEIDPDHVVSNSPVTATQPEMTLSSLSRAAVEYSDNTAANLLLETIGGPAAMTEFFRQLGDDVTRLDRYETELNSNQPGDIRDTTTAQAMSGVLNKLVFGDSLLAAPAKAQLAEWMRAERNGPNRIRAAVPADWKAGNKPGTSNNGAVNDIAIIWPPGRKPVIICIYTNAPTSDVPAGIKAISDVAAILVAEIGA